MLKDPRHLIFFQNLISLIILVFIVSWIMIFLIKEFSVQENSSACPAVFMGLYYFIWGKK